MERAARCACVAPVRFGGAFETDRPKERQAMKNTANAIKDQPGERTGADTFDQCGPHQFEWNARRRALRPSARPASGINAMRRCEGLR